MSSKCLPVLITQKHSQGSAAIDLVQSLHARCSSLTFVEPVHVGAAVAEAELKLKADTCSLATFCGRVSCNPYMWQVQKIRNPSWLVAGDKVLMLKILGFGARTT